jgi:tetratricopeptide (TPR) repeat protein
MHVFSIARFFATIFAEDDMRKLALAAVAMAVQLAAVGAFVAEAQMPGGMGGMGGGGGMGGRGGMGGQPGSDQSIISAPHDDKPDVAARKAYTAGMKSLEKAKSFADGDKKAKNLEKANEAYYKALDQFTEALSNKGDMVEAWNGAGYVHLHIGAYGEALDDYNHDLQLRPDDMDAVANRAEACLQLGRLDDVRIAYLDLFNHARERSLQLMRSMQRWLADRRADPQGFRPADLDAFQRWIDEQLKLAGA